MTAVTAVGTQLADEAVHRDPQPVHRELHDLVVSAEVVDNRGEVLDVLLEVGAAVVLVGAPGLRCLSRCREGADGVEVLLELLELLLHGAELAAYVAVKVQDDALHLRLELVEVVLDVPGLRLRNLSHRLRLHHLPGDLALELLEVVEGLVDRSV